MRFLHTADWHLGTRFHDQRRDEDEAHALEQLLELCRLREVDAVLIAGDVFDNANPGAAEQQRYYRFLSRLVHEIGVASVVVTAGNHDSALRLDGPRELLRGLGIHVIGRLPRDGDLKRCLVPLADRAGVVRAMCAAVPYLRDADLRLPAIGESARQVHERYAVALEERYSQVRTAAGNEYPLVIMGHCYVRGAALGGGERPVQIGNLGLARAAELAGDAAYLALGHLHQPQTIDGKPHWRYSGSLLPTGFDEVASSREVVVVDLNGGEASIESVPITNYRQYLRLQGEAEQLRQTIAELPPPGDAPTPWCEAQVELRGPQPGLAQELMDLCAERDWNLVSVRRSRPRQLPEESAVEREVVTLRELEPEEVFLKRHEAEYGTLPDDELLIDFRRLLEKVTREDDG